MAGLDVDLSSYPKPIVQNTNPLDTIGKVVDIQRGQQALQSGNLTIDKQKLDLINSRFNTMTKDFTALTNNPNLNEDMIRKRIETDVKLGIVTPEMAGTFISQLPPTQGMKGNEAASTLKSHLETWLNHAMTIKEAIDAHYGSPQTIDTGNAIQPVSVSPINGIRSTGLPIQKTLPPTTGGFDQNGQPIFAPPNPNAVTMPPAAPGSNIPLPIARPANANGTGPTGPTVETTPPTPSQIVSQRFMPNPPPLFEEGKKAYTEDQQLASQKMTAVKPALEAYKLLPGLRSGPGTEPFNKAVAFLKANNIISTDQENDKTAIYQEANKYLSQYLKGRGGRSDADLAAAEKSSPNVAYQLNPALIKLTRTAIGQDRIEAARAAAFQDRQDYQNYGAHRAAFPQSVDDRAFSLDLMAKDERDKLVKTMLNKYKNNPKDQEAIKFLKSYDIAKKQGFTSSEDQE